MSVVGVAADAVQELAATRRPGTGVSRVLEGAQELTGVSRPALIASIARLALRDPERAHLPAREAARAQLRVVAALAPLRDVSLWRRDPNGRLRCLECARGRPSRGVRTVARQALRAGEPIPAGPRRTLLAVPVGPAAAPAGVLAARTAAGSAAQGRALLAEAAPLLAFVLEREALLDSSERSTARATGAPERRLARFGLDLHDGPGQTVAALLADMQLFAGQLETALADNPLAEVLEGRVEDLEARAVMLGTEIRELAGMAQAPVSLRDPVAEVLRAEMRGFARATGVEPELRVSGPVDASTPSQRIALLRGIQEALRNAREHARPRTVSVRVTALPGRIEAEVRDDGRGFDPERTLSRARRSGKMGLIGIAERAWLLGGSCEVRSRPGGPTSVAINLPRWAPPAAEPPSVQAPPVSP